MDDILKRLGTVETHVSAVLATLRHLATKADVADVRTEVVVSVTRLIKWTVATGLTSVALACTIGKLLH